MFKKLFIAAALVVALTGQSAYAADFMKMIPEQADFVLHLNVAKILAMPEVQKQIKENFDKQPDQKKTYEELKAKSGFDPLTDITNVAIFSTGDMVEGKEPVAGALIEGKFPVEQIVKIIKEDEGAKKDVDLTVVDGFNCIIPKDKKEGYGMFLDNQFITVGNQPGVEAVKTVKQGKAKNVENKKEFFAILSKLDSKATISGAGLLPKAFKDKCAQNPNAAAFANLQYFNFNFNNDDNLVFNLDAEVDKKENVDTVMTQVNGYLAMIKMFAAQAPEAAEVVNMLTVKNEGTTIKLNLNVPAEKLKELKAKLEEKAKQMQEQQNDANAPRE